MKKVYLAGKITGDPDYKVKFAMVEEMLLDQGYLVMNPAILPEGFTWEEYMEITFSMLRICDTIVMMEGWEDSRGARMEKNYAEAIGKTIIMQNALNTPNTKPENTK